VTSIVAIKRFFEGDPGGRKVQLEELKKLDAAEREELGRAACKELGEEWEPHPRS
jgi:hypothetical protein